MKDETEELLKLRCMLQRLDTNTQTAADIETVRFIVDTLSQFTGESWQEDKYDLTHYPMAIQLLRNVVKKLS